MKRGKKSAARAGAREERPRAAPLLDREEPVDEELEALGNLPLERELEDYNAVSPSLSANDLDASWQEAEDSGEETVGGHAPTPDQDIVDEIGRALGIEFQDNQPLRTHDEVLAKRDRHRWELDRRSADEEGSKRTQSSDVILPVVEPEEGEETIEERGPDSMIGAVMENLSTGAGRDRSTQAEGGEKRSRSGTKQKASARLKKARPSKKK